MATIKDVARLAGVSPSTASRAMHNSHLISEKTKKKVFKAMKTLGYEPNYLAQNLARQTSNTMGVILPVSGKEIFQNPFFMETIRGINEACNEHQYVVTIASGSTDEELIKNIHVMIKRGGVNSFILMYSKHEDPVVKYLRQENISYTVIGKPSQWVNETPYVDNDNILAAREATEYLLQLGHRHICFVYSGHQQMVHADRWSGYKQALLDQGIEEVYSLEVNIFSLSEEQYRIREWLDKRKQITAFIAHDDMIGMMLQRMIDPLQDKDHFFSVISFNNSLFAQMSYPSLTSIDIHAKQLGVEAVNLTIRYLKEPEGLIMKVIVPHQLIIRNSCFRLDKK